MILKAFRLLISNFNTFFYLTIPISVSNLIMLYYSNKFPIDKIIEDNNQKLLIIFIFLFLLNITVTLFFSISLYYSAYRKFKGFENTFLDSVKRGSGKFFQCFALSFLLFFISLIWFTITLLPLIFKFINIYKDSILSYFYIAFLFLSILLFILIFVVPFILFSRPDICIKDNSTILDSLKAGLRRINGKKIRGLLYIILVFIIQTSIILILFYFSFFLVTLINPKITEIINPSLVIDSSSKFSLYFGFTSSIITLILTPFQVCCYVIFYNYLNEEPIQNDNKKENVLDNYLNDIDIKDDYKTNNHS